ncbi:MAG: hypothetical protein SVT52_09425 [Planctomycetota bacterium]|nr:hypothetical protein [Planctomycetota bacterium]
MIFGENGNLTKDEERAMRIDKTGWKWGWAVCLTALAVAVLTFWAMFIQSDPTRRGPYLAVSYEIEPFSPEELEQEPSKSFAKKVAKTLAGRLELEVLAVGDKRVEVRVPIEDNKPVMTLEAVNKKLRPISELEFRIAPYVSDDIDHPPLNPEEYAQYMQPPHRDGPPRQSREETPFQWVPLRLGAAVPRNLVVAEAAGKKYILLSRESAVKASVSERSIKRVYRGADGNNRPAVFCEFSGLGAQRMAALTAANKGRVLAIIMHGEIYSALVIKDAITDRCMITWGVAEDEAMELVAILDQESVPFRVKSPPVSVRRGHPHKNARVSRE